MADPHAVQIRPGQAEGSLTERQTRFNDLVREVAVWRAALADWQARIARFDQSVGPVRRELHAAWRQWVLALDVASLQPGLSGAERAQLGELLREAATAWLEAGDDDAEIASVLDRHAPFPARPVTASDSDAPAEDAAIPDWEAMAAAAAALREQRSASRRAAKRREREAQAAQEVSQSVRDVYRKLASALHPDREGDARQRQRKTLLMQQANQAYAEGNLLVLLELQVEAEEVGTAQLEALDDRRLRHYISVLQDQLEQLQAETRRLEAGFRAAAGLGPGAGLQPRKADRLITSETQRLRGDLLLLRRQARLLADVGATRSWLREQRKA